MLAVKMVAMLCNECYYGKSSYINVIVVIDVVS